MALAVRKPSSENQEVYRSSLIESMEKRVGKLREMTGDVRERMLSLIEKYMNPTETQDVAENYDLFHLPKDGNKREIIEGVVIQLKNSGLYPVRIYDEEVLSLGKLVKEGKLNI